MNNQNKKYRLIAQIALLLSVPASSLAQQPGGGTPAQPNAASKQARLQLINKDSTKIAKLQKRREVEAMVFQSISQFMKPVRGARAVADTVSNTESKKGGGG